MVEIGAIFTTRSGTLQPRKISSRPPHSHEKFSRCLKEILPEFNSELLDFCMLHCMNRNAELHTGEERFAGINALVWLPKYYAACDVLLKSMGRTLGNLFADPKAAEEMISALKDTAAKAVAKDIESYKRTWTEKIAGEREQALAQATVWATRHAGHRTACPSCGSPSLIKGKSWGEVSTEMDDDTGLIIQRQSVLPSSFECIACGLKISGWSKLSAAGLGDAFTDTHTSSAAEYFNLHTEEELAEAQALAEPVFEEDFNEY